MSRNVRRFVVIGLLALAGAGVLPTGCLPYLPLIHAQRLTRSSVSPRGSSYNPGHASQIWAQGTEHLPYRWLAASAPRVMYMRPSSMTNVSPTFDEQRRKPGSRTSP